MLKRIMGRISAAAISVGLYLPIIAGLISPMVWVLAGWYFSWGIFSYIVPFSETWHHLWFMSSPIHPEELRIGISVVFRFSQVLIFCFGIFLLCYGLVSLVKGRARGEGLVTYGPYKWVRHPQHLGILLMLFLLAFPFETSYSRLLNPITRPGDLVSMSSVLFLLILVADIEDYRMSKEFGDAYTQYRQNTPFMLPVRVQLPKSIDFNSLERGRPLRYIVAILIFWGFLVLLSYYSTLFPLTYLYR